MSYLLLWLAQGPTQYLTWQQVGWSCSSTVSKDYARIRTYCAVARREWVVVRNALAHRHEWFDPMHSRFVFSDRYVSVLLPAASILAEVDAMLAANAAMLATPLVVLDAVYSARRSWLQAGADR